MTEQHSETWRARLAQSAISVQLPWWFSVRLSRHRALCGVCVCVCVCVCTMLCFWHFCVHVHTSQTNCECVCVWFVCDGGFDLWTWRTPIIPWSRSLLSSGRWSDIISIAAHCSPSVKVRSYCINALIQKPFSHNESSSSSSTVLTQVIFHSLWRFYDLYFYGWTSPSGFV